MTNQEWIDMLRVIPEEEQNTLVIVLQNGAEINIDTMVQFEPNFLVMRGRVGGNTDDGRGFFVPYDQMLYFRIERITTLAMLRNIMDGSSKSAPIAAPAAADVPLPAPNAPGVPSITDATASRNALLDRIRAARVTQGPTRMASQ